MYLIDTKIIMIKKGKLNDLDNWWNERFQKYFR